MLVESVVCYYNLTSKPLATLLYSKSGNFRVIKFLCFKFSLKKYFHDLGYPQKFLTVLNQFYVPRFSALERDYVC